ncbi:phosphatidate cytidylyltransferase [Streptomyces xiaopingdaonensis]|uniref:phosphatidate cytidylyltransferase n=1 Tax=Streptomyces xiaopingdaonensis TaxID=1565415 RepID=UPI00187312B7|nr:phosphatidate cytidylyltransferase [Streptomyces xiaopingdaonensis]
MNEPSWGAPSPNAGSSGAAGPYAPGVGGGSAEPRHAVTPEVRGDELAETRPAPAVSPRGSFEEGGPRHDRPEPGGTAPGTPSEGAPESAAPHAPPRTPGASPRPADVPSAGAPAPAGSTAAGGRAGSGEETAKPASEPAPKKRAGRNLGAAIGVGVTLGAVVVASLLLYKPVFVGVIVVAVVVGLWELTSRLKERKDIRAPLVPLAVGGAAMVVVGYAWGAEASWVAMGFTALAVLVWRMTDSPTEYLRDVTAGVFAAFYVPFLASFVALMLVPEDGAWRVLVFLLLTVVADTGAYAVGWWFGKHKLAPRISPGKTREGLAGAIAFAMAAGALCLQFLIDGGTWWQGLLLGLAVAVTATLGDLGESMIKRDLGIKDMGSLLPGHGGIMDRLDSLLPTAPVVWVLLAAFVGTT